MPQDVLLSHDDKQISLSEFVDSLEREQYSFNGYDDLLASAVYLKRLGNNKEFLLQYVYEELKTIYDFQRANYYGPQVFMLHSCAKYFVRANVWKPLSRVERAIAGFQYDVCHDHNFDILTIGYWGPGYRARTYQYDAQNVCGLLGEKVEMIPEGETILSEGRMLLYRAKRYIHIQMPPDELSISINLIPRNNKIELPQFQFDESNQTICRYLHSSGQELIVRLAGSLGDEGVGEILNHLGASHKSPHLRALAQVSAWQIAKRFGRNFEAAPSHADTGRERELISDIVRRETERYGACLTHTSGPAPRQVEPGGLTH